MRYRVTQYDFRGDEVAHRDYRWRWLAWFVAWAFEGESMGLGLRLSTKVTEVHE